MNQEQEASTLLKPVAQHAVMTVCRPADVQTVRLYDADRQQLRATHTQAQAVLDTTFEDDTVAFAAGLEGSVQRCTWCTEGGSLPGCWPHARQLSKPFAPPFPCQPVERFADEAIIVGHCT